MAKIGRNEQCPCQSGKKYKHCCSLKVPRLLPQPTPQQVLKITLMGSVKAIQQDAVRRRKKFHELGVFFFFSTTKGDAWVMEMTDCDCVQVARGGQALEPPIDENSQTIEVNWSHTFTVNNRKVEITAYDDKSVTTLDEAPGRELAAAMKQVRAQFSEEQLKKVHLPAPEDPPAP